MSKRHSNGSWGVVLAAALVALTACGSDLAAPNGAQQDEDGGGAPCGRSGSLCAAGRTCEGAPDCASTICRGGTCQIANAPNGGKDSDETDVDCGGGHSAACADGKACLVKDDCLNAVCTGGTCQPPNGHDGVRNGDETDLDCGGTNAPKCALGQGCASTADCNELKCDDATKKCLPPSHDDGLKNDGETGKDCGGTATAKCPTGEGCAITGDCDKAVCNATTNVCDPPSHTDEIQNGDETDVDCGGSASTKCATEKGCAKNEDCASTVCNYALKCVEAPSCRAEYGGDTCGSGEVGMAGAARESCCKSIALPGTNAGRLDKYEITAGRMREFIRAVGNNVQASLAQGQTAVPAGLIKYLPTSTTEPDGYGVYAHLGNTVFFGDLPSVSQGCWVGAGQYQIGHPTYYWDSATQNEQWGAAPRTFTQDELDVKSLNCVAPLLLEAFCAWDSGGGGRLATFAELGADSANSAWGTALYPWGNTPTSKQTTSTDPTVCPGIIPYPSNASYSLIPMPSDYASAAKCNPTNVNVEKAYDPAWPAVRYAWPAIAQVGNDTAFLVAAPGRMKNDYRAFAGQTDGFYDVAGNLMEATHNVTGTDVGHMSMPVVNWVGGSFEGHAVARAQYSFNVLVKYGKMGGRCWRP